MMVIVPHIFEFMNLFYMYQVRVMLLTGAVSQDVCLAVRFSLSTSRRHAL